MTTLRQAAQAALEALIVGDRLSMHIGGDDEWRTIAWPAIDALRAALEAPEVEPYLHVYEYDSEMGLHREFYPRVWNGLQPARTTPLYAAPPQPRERCEELEAALEALVNRCNAEFVLAADEAVIAAEAALERLHRARTAAPAQPHKAQEVEPVGDLIAGALYDLMGHLTSRKEVLTLGSTEWATPAVDALVAFAEKRGLSLNNPAIETWFKNLAPPQPRMLSDCDEEVRQLSELVAMLDKRCAEYEREPQPREPVPGARWYAVSRDGAATLCVDEADARQVAEENSGLYPHLAPYRAVQLVEPREPVRLTDAQHRSAQCNRTRTKQRG